MPKNHQKTTFFSKISLSMSTTAKTLASLTTFVTQLAATELRKLLPAELRKKTGKICRKNPSRIDQFFYQLFDCPKVKFWPLQ